MDYESGRLPLVSTLFYLRKRHARYSLPERLDHVFAMRTVKDAPATTGGDVGA